MHNELQSPYKKITRWLMFSKTEREERTSLEAKVCRY